MTTTASAPASEPAVVAPVASEPAMPAASAAPAAHASAAASAATSDLAADVSAVQYENQVLSFYFAIQSTGVEDFIRLVTPAAKEQYAVGLWQRAQRKIGQWMQGQLLLCLGEGRALGKIGGEADQHGEHCNADERRGNRKLVDNGSALDIEHPSTPVIEVHPLDLTCV